MHHGARVWRPPGISCPVNFLAIQVAKVDCTTDENKDLCDELKVEYYPIVFLYKDGQEVEAYADRSLNDLVDFVDKHLPKAAHDEF